MTDHKPLSWRVQCQHKVLSKFIYLCLSQLHVCLFLKQLAKCIKMASKYKKIQHIKYCECLKLFNRILSVQMSLEPAVCKLGGSYTLSNDCD